MFLRDAAKRQHAAMVAEAQAHDEWRAAIRLQSTGGATSGKSLVAPLGTSGARFSDQEWSLALQWRLEVPGQAGTCRNCAADGELCGARLDAWPDHAMGCHRGPLRLALHNQLADYLATCIEEAGAHARTEAFVPEFTKATGQGAFADVSGFGKCGCAGLLLDVTVRHEAQPCYRSATWDWRRAEHRAEADKAARYPSTSGAERRSRNTKREGAGNALREA